ncbi:MAG: GIY-YIG nuclease family protein [Cytophagales bacterium]|nr:GIY-YIG nuclease family protein [Cytophagales bacterium]
MNYTVYVLRSLNHNKTYVGLTSDIERRLAEHNAGRSRSTKPNRPWELIYHEEYESRDEARKREKYLKSGSGRELLRKILNSV